MTGSTWAPGSRHSNSFQGGSLLKAEAVPVGYPIIFDALPDIDSFYREWRGRPLPDEREFKDMTYEVTREWGK